MAAYKYKAGKTKTGVTITNAKTGSAKQKQMNKTLRGATATRKRNNY